MVTTRRRNATSEVTAAKNTNIEDELSELAAESSPTTSNFIFKGVSYNSYEEMVKAKRMFNNEMLKKSGLLEASASFRENASGVTMKKVQASQRGLRVDRKRKDPTVPLSRRKSSRIAGVQADGMYIEDERSGGRIVIGAAGSSSALIPSEKVYFDDEKDKFYNNRVNDGSDLTIQDAVELVGHKWMKNTSVKNAEHCFETLSKLRDEISPTGSKEKASCSLVNQVDRMSVDNEKCVAKVVPDRIHSVAFHPSEHKLIAVTGDKKGYLGFWEVDALPTENDSETDGVTLFKPHAGAINSLEWNKSGSKLLSLSYDGTVRLFDINRQVFTEAFAAYDNSDEFKSKLGYGMDEGSKFYTQYACYDHRNEECIFLSTSLGGTGHIDLRVGKMTFDLSLSNKKINSVSLHPNGHTLATAGLDCEVNLWDIRKFTGLQSGSKLKPFTTQISSRSINSAFFSPSGKNLLTTTMANTLDIISDAHLQNGLIKNPNQRIKHHNQTGRWLSTFMAQWHPTATNEELFVVGSMSKPRRMEFFDGSTGEMIKGLDGECLTAVASRCCFHPSTRNLIALGGNSSGRLTIAR